MKVSFSFTPNFLSLEEFLKFYQTQHKKNELLHIELVVSDAYFTTMPGYPDRERNSWLTLRYAVEQMNQAFYAKKSQVKIEIAEAQS